MGTLRGKTWGGIVIPVEPKPEPPDFDQKVRIPGMQYLRDNPNPTSWDNKEYWRECLLELYSTYNRICAYSAHWIPRDTGLATVDHFIPKSVNASMAYEWDNYRLSSHRMNSRKREYQDVLDPFEIKEQTFVIDFLTLEIKPIDSMNANMIYKADNTIKRLKLNDTLCVESRIDWLEPFTKEKYGFDFLEEKAPLLAYEIKRQKISRKKLKEIFRKPRIKD